MLRGVLAAVGMGLLGCGGSDGPPVTQVTVTVKQGGVVVNGTAVIESTAVDESTRPPTPTGVLATQSTNASGQTTFSVPSSTPTGILCFTSTIGVGSTSYVGDCRTLNMLTPTIDLFHP
jgi:hypothetical protein